MDSSFLIYFICLSCSLPPKISMVSTHPAIIYTWTVPTRCFSNRKMAFKISFENPKSHWFQHFYNLLYYFLDINTIVSNVTLKILTNLSKLTFSSLPIFAIVLGVVAIAHCKSVFFIFLSINNFHIYYMKIPYHYPILYFTFLNV